MKAYTIASVPMSTIAISCNATIAATLSNLKH